MSALDRLFNPCLWWILTPTGQYPLTGFEAMCRAGKQLTIML
ncbi:Uncharacterised protein [Vibrio cholerae]|nr:Uncharacterised protein [Vibrio cholerae]